MAKKEPKRPINEQDKINLAKGKKFSKDYQPPAENKSKGKQEAIAERKEIEKSAEILNRLLSENIENSKTGQVLTKKEAMLLGVLAKAIKEHDLKAVELVLKIIGDLDNKITLDSKGLNIFVADDKHKEMLEDL
jgi:hypothetical protein